MFVSVRYARFAERACTGASVCVCMCVRVHERRMRTTQARVCSVRALPLQVDAHMHIMCLSLARVQVVVSEQGTPTGSACALHACCMRMLLMHVL
jgi:hypothetical protein